MVDGHAHRDLHVLQEGHQGLRVHLGLRDHLAHRRDDRQSRHRHHRQDHHLGGHQSHHPLEDHRYRLQDADHQNQGANRRGHQGHQGDHRCEVHQALEQVHDDQEVEELDDQTHSWADRAEAEWACPMD